MPVIWCAMAQALPTCFTVLKRVDSSDFITPAYKGPICLIEFVLTGVQGAGAAQLRTVIKGFAAPKII